MLAKLRNFMVTCAGAFAAFGVGIPLFMLVFISPTFVTRSDIMILAGWFIWIPAFAIAGPVRRRRQSSCTNCWARA